MAAPGYGIRLMPVRETRSKLALVQARQYESCGVLGPLTLDAYSILGTKR